ASGGEKLDVARSWSARPEPRRRASRVTPTDAACAMQRSRSPNANARKRFSATVLGAGILTLLGLAACARGESGQGAAPPAFEDLPARGGSPPFLPPLAHAPLDTPLVVTDDFGERRGNHFHAALDFSTGRRVGMPVYAPDSGWIERVRASGG